MLGPNTEEGNEPVGEVSTGPPTGTKSHRVKKPTNMAKTSEVLQKPDESPADYKRLCEAFWVFTILILKPLEYQRLINAAFVGQAQYDIQKNSTEVRRVRR